MSFAASPRVGFQNYVSAKGRKLRGGFTDAVETRIIVEVNFAQCGSFKLSLQPTASCSDTRLELPAEKWPFVGRRERHTFPCTLRQQKQGQKVKDRLLCSPGEPAGRLATNILSRLRILNNTGLLKVTQNKRCRVPSQDILTSAL